MNKLIKYLLLFIAVAVMCGGYWYFFSERWTIAITKDQFWYYGFIDKNQEDLKGLNVEQKKEEFSVENSSAIALQVTINIKNTNDIVKGKLSFNPKYSAKIYVNNQFLMDVNKNLILPKNTTDANEITIEEHWRNREIEIPNAFLQNGPNIISLVIYNTQDFKTIKTNNIPLTFLVKGKSSGFSNIYKVPKPKTTFSSSKLPLFKINTFNKVIPDEPKTNALLTIANTKKINLLSDSTNSYPIKIERRGNTSQTFAKKSYSFSLSQKDSLLGISSAKKWVLYGPYADKSLIRNALAYSLYNQMGNYAPKTEFIELIINNNYQGIYVLTEKIQIGKNHINIPKLTEKKDGIKGGYVIEVDRNTIKAPFPNDSTAHNSYYGVYEPKQRKLKKKTLKLIKEQYGLFEKHFFENDNYLDHIDINSFVDYMIITEVCRNIDGYRLSTFMYNPDINAETPKFYMGPIWDYNFSFGLANYHDGHKTEGFVYNVDKYVPFYWHKLLQDSVFKTTLKNRYTTLRQGCLSNKNINKTIDKLVKKCEPSLNNNFKKWDVLEVEDFWPNHFLGKTHQQEIDYIKKWTKKRLLFLDEKF